MKKWTSCVIAGFFALCVHHAQAQQTSDALSSHPMQRDRDGSAAQPQPPQAGPAVHLGSPQAWDLANGIVTANAAPAIAASGNPTLLPEARSPMNPILPPPAVLAQQAPASTPAAPPGQTPIDIVAAERALQQTLVAQGLALLPYGQIQVEPAFWFMRNEVSFPSFIAGSTPGTVTVANSELRQDIYIGDVAIRAGLPLRSELEVDVPYRYIQQQTNVSVGLVGHSIIGMSSGGGMSDVTVTLDKTLLTEGVWRPNLIGAIQYSSNTGAIVDGFFLGNGYPLVRALLTLTKSVDPIVFAATVGFGKGFEASGFQPGNEFDVNLGAFLSASPETTLRFQLNQRYLNTGTINGNTFVGSGLTQSTFVAGASVIIAPHVLLDVSTGIGLTSDTPKFYVRVSLPITFSVL
jgi:hypothetical protein